jgi:hypothetical protein
MDTNRLAKPRKQSAASIPETENSKIEFRLAEGEFTALRTTRAGSR